MTRHSLSGGAWLLADMGLMICSQSIVKHLGLEYSSSQMVFFRALTGLAVMLPWILPFKFTNSAGSTGCRFTSCGSRPQPSP